MSFRSFVYGAVLGGIAGLLFAPETGRRTRALIRDKAVRYSNDTQDFVQKKSRHIANKARGYTHEVSKALTNIGCHKAEEPAEEAQAAV
jgi:gas vesicle protein